MAAVGQRTGTKGKVLLGLVAAVLFVAAGFAAISLFGTGSDLMSLSPTESAHESARRVNTVLATGDLTNPPGVTSQTTLDCDQGSGYPGLTVVYVGSGPAASGNPVRRQLSDAGWRETETQYGYLYQKRFGNWSANLALVTQDNKSAGPLLGHLTVEGPIDADCTTFRREAR